VTDELKYLHTDGQSHARDAHIISSRQPVYSSRVNMKRRAFSLRQLMYVCTLESFKLIAVMQILTFSLSGLLLQQPDELQKLFLHGVSKKLCIFISVITASNFHEF